MTVRVDHLQERDDEELIRFLDALGADSPSVLAYHYPLYREVIRAAGAGTPVFYGARVGGELRGVLPAFRATSPAGTVSSSLPFFGPNAGVLAPAANLDVHTALLSAFLEESRGADGALSASVYTPFLGSFDAYTAALPRALIVEKTTQYLDLDTARWSKDVAYDLRKAERLGVRVTSEFDASRIDAFYTLYAQNCAEYQIPLKPRSCVERLFREDVLGSRGDVFFALHEERLIGGLLVLRGPRTASYYLPCTLPAARTLQPGTVLIDAAVTSARQHGVRYWNWESSPDRESGVFQFKKKWGSLEAPYRIYVEPFRDEAEFRALGRERIAQLFPFMFVYPFDRLG